MTAAFHPRTFTGQKRSAIRCRLEAVNRPTGRVLTLLELLQSGGLRTTAELADRLGVDGRTVRRYIDHLIELDLPVEAVRGRYGGYRLAPGYRLPPLMFSDEEALAVLLGLIGGGRPGPTAALDTAGETAAAKIRRVLPARLGRGLDALLDSVSFTDRPGGHAAVDANVLLTLADAARHGRPVALRYTDRGGTTGDRVLEPYGIVNHRGRWYVTGRDTGLDDERTFRLDRVSSARTVPGSFSPPPGPDPAQRVLAGFATADYRYEVTLWIRGTVEQIRTRLPAAIAVVHEPSPTSPEDAPASPEGGRDAEPWRRVDMRVERLDWLPPLIAALDLPFRVERPAELRDLVLALADRLRQSVSQDSSSSK